MGKAAGYRGRIAIELVSFRDYSVEDILCRAKDQSEIDWHLVSFPFHCIVTLAQVLVHENDRSV